MCQPRPLFIFVLSKHKFYRRNCELQWDSNSDRRSRRQALWPLDDHQGPWTQLIFYQWLCVTFAIILAFVHAAIVSATMKWSICRKCWRQVRLGQRTLFHLTNIASENVRTNVLKDHIFWVCFNSCKWKILNFGLYHLSLGKTQPGQGVSYNIQKHNNTNKYVQ